PDGRSAMTDILVVGAGLLGASVAHRLAERGAQVTILESGRPGGGTSGASFAWVNAQDKTPAAYFELNRDGLRAHRALVAELGGDWFHAGGDLAIGRSDGAATLGARIERHRALDYPVERLDRAGIERLEPVLDLGDADDIVGAHYLDEGWIDVPHLIDGLLAAAQSSGAVLIRDEVAAVERDGDRAIGIRTADGTLRRGDRVVLAAGPATQGLAATVGVTLPMAPSPGLLVRVSPVAATVGRVIHGGDVALRPDGDGRLLLTSRGVDASLDPELRHIALDDPAVTQIIARAARLIPDLHAGAPVFDARIGIRSVAVDGMPAVGPAPGLDALYLLVSHSGATLAPVLGGLVAQELVDGPQARLEPYRVDRFTAVEA
ncbi:MAG: NAD(P)/FAD-dependent oxidoreductase, partial [Candidatus Limnocylindrales bacterium]